MKPGIYDLNKPSRSHGRRWLVAAIIVALLVVAFLLLALRPDTTDYITANQLAQLINDGRVESIENNDDTLLVTVTGDETPAYEVKLGSTVEDLPAFLMGHGADSVAVSQVDFSYNNTSNSDTLILLWPLLWIVFIALALVGIGIFIGTRINTSRSGRKTRKLA